MINKLLVAVDGSSHSLKAVDYASEIANCCNASVIILTVIKVHMMKELSAETRTYAKLEQIPGADLDAWKMIAGELVASVANVRSRSRRAITAMPRWTARCWAPPLQCLLSETNPPSGGSGWNGKFQPEAGVEPDRRRTLRPRH